MRPTRGGAMEPQSPRDPRTAPASGMKTAIVVMQLH